MQLKIKLIFFNLLKLYILHNYFIKLLNIVLFFLTFIFNKYTRLFVYLYKQINFFYQGSN